MVLVTSLSDVSWILTCALLLVVVLYLYLIRRALVGLTGGIADRHVEVRMDLKNARGAHERQHQETIQAVSNFAQSITEAMKHPDDRKTVDMETLATRAEAGPAKEQPPTVRGAKLQASALPAGDGAEGNGERPRETEDKTLVWTGVPSGRTLVGIGASGSPPVTVGGSVDAGASGG